MFRKIKNFITGHKHDFNIEETTTSFHFNRIDVKDVYVDNSLFGGTSIFYNGFWERCEKTTDLCLCGEHGESVYDIVKVKELSNGKRIIEVLNNLALRGIMVFTHPDKKRRVKVSMSMKEARGKLNELLTSF